MTRNAGMTPEKTNWLNLKRKNKHIPTLCNPTRKTPGDRPRVLFLSLYLSASAFRKSVKAELLGVFFVVLLVICGLLFLEISQILVSVEILSLELDDRDSDIGAVV